MKNVCVFFAEGFEEVEAITIVDLLRRGGVNVDTVSISEDYMVTGSKSIPIKTDKLFSQVDFSNLDALLLPGGMPGTTNLLNHKPLTEQIVAFNNENKLIGAICAAPMIFGELGLLEGKKACCYPGMEDKLKGAIRNDASVSVDQNIITSKGVGTAIDFSLALIEYLISKEKALEVKKSIVF